MKSIIIRSVLWVGVILLAYFGLYANITNEIHVRDVMDIRKSQNIQKLQDLAEIQIRFKRDHGFYAGSEDELLSYLNSSVEVQNTDKADKILIADNKDLWDKIREQIIEERKITKSDINAEAKKIYKEAGGKWDRLSKKEEIEQGYIKVTKYIAKQLVFTEDYIKTRSSKSYKLDLNDFSNIKELNNKLSSFSNFTSSLNTNSKLIEKLEVQSTFNNIKNNKSNLFDGDTSTSINKSSLESIIKNHNKDIEEAKKDIQSKKNEQRIAKDSLSKINERISTYTTNIGSDKILKAKDKAKKKQDKGKKIKGRTGKIFTKISQLENKKKEFNSIIAQSKEYIKNKEEEIKSRKEIINSLDKNIQFLHDIKAMQKEYNIRNKKESENFNNLVSYMLNEEITIETRNKRSPKPTPNLPEEWNNALEKAQLMAEEKLEKGIKLEIETRYEDAGGEMRRLTQEEAEERDLITISIVPVIDLVFNESYLDQRSDYPLNLDSLFYISNSKEKYSISNRISTKYNITNRLIDTLMSKNNFVKFKDTLLAKKIREDFKAIEKKSYKELGPLFEKFDKTANKEVQKFIRRNYNRTGEEILDIDIYLEVLGTSKSQILNELIIKNKKLNNLSKEIVETLTTHINSTEIFDQLEMSEKYKIILLLEEMSSDMEMKETWNEFTKYHTDTLNLGSILISRYGFQYAMTTTGNEFDVESGSRNKFFFEISTSYDNIFDGLDKENLTVRNHDEKNKREDDGEISVAKIAIGSLIEEISNGNWE